MINNIQHIVFIFVLTFFAISCKKPLDINVEIEKIVAAKTLKHSEREYKKCRMIASENAEMHVDSIISQWVAKEIVDTIKIPSKPLKPNTPEHILGTLEPFEN